MQLLLAFSLLVQTPPTGPAAELHLYRFWREPNITTVAAFLTIPLSDLTLAPDSVGNKRLGAYQVHVVVSDSSGLVLRSGGWSQQVRSGRGSLPADAQAVENIPLELSPGLYDLKVAVTDSLSGRTFELRQKIRAGVTRPLSSDLVLAREIKEAPEDAKEGPQGSLLRYGTLITPHIQEEFPWELEEIALYAEMYPPALPADTLAQASIVLRRTEDGLLQETPPRPRRYPPQGGIEMLNLPLGGLQPGEYRVGLKVEYADTTVVIEQQLALEAPPLRAVELNPFANYDEFALDSLLEMASYIARPEETRVYRGLTLDAKRRFMHEFWLRRDPTPGPPNEAYDQFMEAVHYSNREFGSGERPGWTTPRGRIYITYGPPAERYTHPVTDRAIESWPPGRMQRPFEIWKYMGGRNDKYVFYDQSEMGYYHLVYTTNPYEPTDPNWERLFDPALVRFINQF